MEQARVVAVTDVSRWRRQIERALESDIYGLTYAEIEQGIESGEYVAIVLHEKAVVVFDLLVDAEGRKSLHAIACGGEDMDSWLPDLMESWRQIAKEQGCYAMTLQGRKGWAKALRKYGFRHYASSYCARVEQCH